jgi:HAMP domain-containing protein
MGGGGMVAAGARVRIEVQLRDGTWARFDTALPAQPEALPWRLALSLAVLLAAVLALSFIAVRWVVRPLQQLTAAAQALGEDLNRPPLPEDGPREVQQAARPSTPCSSGWRPSSTSARACSPRCRTT